MITQARGILVAIALVFVGVACEATIDESLTSLAVGDCVSDAQLGDIETIDTIDCDEPGAIKVLDIFDIEGYGDEYPGDDVVEAEAAEGCPASSTTYLSPTSESWEEAGDREIVCFE